MHMAVVESGTDEPVVQIDDLCVFSGVCHGQFVCPGINEVLCFCNKCLAEGQGPGINLSVDIDLPHMMPPYLNNILFFI